MTLPVTVTLGEVATFIRGITFKPEDVVPVGTENSVACLRTKNIQASLSLSDVWAVDERLVRRGDKILQSGDILISSANSWNLVGKCCWISELPWKASFGGFVTVLRANPEKIFPRFLYWWFSSDRIQALARSFGNKTTSISNLNIERCLSLSFSLPDLQQQKRIAQALDQADSLRLMRRAAISELENLTQAIFNEMFGDPFDNPHQLPVSPLIDLVSPLRPISYGILMPGPDQDEGVSYVRVVDMKDGGIDIKSVRKTTVEISTAFKRSLLKEGDILMSIRGHVGRLASVPPELEGANITQDTARLAVDESKVLPVFARECLRTAGVQRWMAKHIKGVAVRGINLADVKRIPVILPSIERQEEFVLKVRSIESLVSIYRIQLDQLEKLFSVLQHRAFRGEL
ncbi:restriction endonuclease subunit S [Pseudomonas sp. TH49]|uniref:restriction endonuclease subunit S n=1 Tax=Pseudomonas sp. TH49 TaxID=2796413 RepID=UPI0019136491|nr:restriction endonuclease subunit S [Pseudomonas sp. TH49]MBK5341853.1 restriction endonuclease subunit S [Pseudomonas sp. TH49]